LPRAADHFGPRIGAGHVSTGGNLATAHTNATPVDSLNLFPLPGRATLDTGSQPDQLGIGSDDQVVERVLPDMLVIRS
jgi:hypothetical protein